jgi:hypothetical protein
MGGLSVGSVQPDEVRRVRGAPDPAFLIVGTARSGTTLIQRLACSLEGVRVPPETHFRNFMKTTAAGRTFPMDEAELRATLVAFKQRKAARGLAIDADAIVDDLAGRCDDPWQLFGALVRSLAGPAAVYGEKTPEHLRWWRPLTAHFPSIRLIGVVREPRAVVASSLQVPFGPRSHHLLSERWQADQRQLDDARRTLPPERCLVLRYEDVVADPAAHRDRLAAFLGIDPSREADVAPETLRQDWEWWKGRSDGPVTTDRVEAWREVLSTRQSRDVTSICRGAMETFGYRDRPGAVRAALTRSTFRPSVQRARRRYRRSVRDELAWAVTL